MSQFLSPQVPWYYNWKPEPSDDATGLSVEFVPMLWGKNQTETFSETINDTISALNVTTVLGMNEPQEPGQSNLTAAEGAHMWQQYLEPLRSRNIRLGSPAPSGAPGSTEWLTNFLNECGQGCTVDFLVLHSYGTNATAFKEFLVNYHEVFKLNIWVTEWACQNMQGPQNQCSMSDVTEFMQETQEFMNQMEWVERYAWYGAKTAADMHGVNIKNAMMDTDGVINDLGRQYIDTLSHSRAICHRSEDPAFGFAVRVNHSRVA
ncbi:glycoside hydrolase [Mycena olivaceomarginata]|nr:glycoside hydrolase [Mycena olivaceomarginata]